MHLTPAEQPPALPCLHPPLRPPNIHAYLLLLTPDTLFSNNLCGRMQPDESLWEGRGFIFTSLVKAPAVTKQWTLVRRMDQMTVGNKHHWHHKWGMLLYFQGILCQIIFIRQICKDPSKPNDPDNQEKSRCSESISSTGIYLSSPCLHLSIVQSPELWEQGRCSELICRTDRIRKRERNVCLCLPAGSAEAKSAAIFFWSGWAWIRIQTLVFGMVNMLFWYLGWCILIEMTTDNNANELG